MALEQLLKKMKSDERWAKQDGENSINLHLKPGLFQ